MNLERQKKPESGEATELLASVFPRLIPEVPEKENSSAVRIGTNEKTVDSENPASFRQLRIHLADFPESGNSPDNEQIGGEEETESVLKLARNILRQESQAVFEQIQRLDEDFCKAVSLILNCSGNVVVTGMGKAGLIGQKIAATLSSTGTPSHFLHPAEAFHGDLGTIRSGDCLIILSYSGETEEITRLIPALKKRHFPIIAITAHRGSTLGRRADVLLSMGTLAEADSWNLAPSTSTTVMLALGDALALVVSRKRNFRAEDFARFHPGGSLGRKLSHVEEMMRPITQCRVASEERTIREIFVQCRQPGRRSGAILLTDGLGRLSGIFTDSDLAKLFERRNDEFLDLPVCSVMTRTPQTVRVGTRMLDAVAVMGERKISELPVLDPDGIPIGMLDITDLVGFFPEPSEINKNHLTG